MAGSILLLFRGFLTNSTVATKLRIDMNTLLQRRWPITFDRLRRLAVVLIAGCLMLVATACTPSDTTASGQMDVPDATQADVERAQSNLSDEAVDEDVLSQQGASQARRSDASSIQ